MTDQQSIYSPSAKTGRGTFNSQPLHAAQIADALLNIKTVGAITGLSNSTIFRKTAAGEFPQPTRLGARCTRWRAGDVTAWLTAAAGRV